VLRATTACNFSSLIWPAGSAPATLASLLFDPPEPQIIGKHSVSRLSYLFAHLHLLSSDSFSSLIFSLLLSLFSGSVSKVQNESDTKMIETSEHLNLLVKLCKGTEPNSIPPLLGKNRLGNGLVNGNK
jgi:hypothetical protein